VEEKKIFFGVIKMHYYWAYGLALLLIVLLFIAAIYIAHEENQENQEDKKDRRLRNKSNLLRPRKTPFVQLPLDFGAL